MGIYRHKRSFSAGELSPLMDARLDLDRYKNGAKRMRNVYVKPQGAVTRRQGTKQAMDITPYYKAASGNDISDELFPRIIPFIFSENQAYVLIFLTDVNGDSKILIVGSDGQVVNPPESRIFQSWDMSHQTKDFTIYYNEDHGLLVSDSVINYGFDTNNASLQLELDAPTPVLTVPDTKTITVNYPSYHQNDIVNLSEGYGVTLLESEVSTLSAGADAVDLPVLEVPIPAGPNPPGDFDLRKFDYAQSGDILNIVQRQRQPMELIRADNDDWSISNTVFVDQPSEWSDDPLEGWPGFVAYYEQRIVYVSNYGRPQTCWFSKSADLNNFGVSSPIAEDDALTFTLNSGIQNKVTWVVPSTRLLIGTLGDEWTLGGAGGNPLSYNSVRAVKQTNKGSEHIKPLIINSSTLFVERLGRVVNRFVYDYNTDSYRTQDLSILAPHFTENFPIINWTYQQHPNSIVWSMRSDGLLLGLTFSQEHKIFAWHGHPMVNGLVKDACSVPGLNEDWVFLVVERTIENEKHYYLEYIEEEFKSDDMTDAYYLDSHDSFEGKTTDIELVSVNDISKEYTLRVLSGDTSRIIIDHTRISWENVINTRNIKLTEQIKQPTVITTVINDTDFGVVYSEHESGDEAFFESEDPTKEEFALFYAKTLIGLDHLEGETVGVLANGATHEDRIVVNGQIELNNYYSWVVVGKNIQAQLQPTLADLEMATGTIIGRMSRVTNIIPQLYKTVGLLYGPDWVTLEELPMRYEDNLTGQQIPLFTGIPAEKISFQEGSSRDTSICIEQNKPLPLTIVGIVDEIEVEDG